MKGAPAAQATWDADVILPCDVIAGGKQPVVTDRPVIAFEDIIPLGMRCVASEDADSCVQVAHLSDTSEGCASLCLDFFAVVWRYNPLETDWQLAGSGRLMLPN